MLSAYKRILCIKNLPDYTDATINTLFKFGKILSHIFIPATDPHKKDAIVELESEHLAIKARKELHGKVIGDSKLDVDFASTKEAQTLIDITLKGSETKTSVLDRIITQKDLKDPTGKEGLKNNSSMTPEKIVEKEKEVASGKRNLEKRIERNEDGLLEKEGPSYEEIQKKIKINNNSLTLSPKEFQALRGGHDTLPQHQLEKFHETDQASLPNMKEERVNDQTHENHQVKIEHKSHTLASGNESSEKKKKEDSQDVVETLLANNPELKNQIGNPEILKAFFDAFRQEVHSMINKTPFEREQSEVKNEHKSSRSKRKSHSKSKDRSSSNSSRHRHRSRRRKRSYSKSRSSSTDKRKEKIDRHSHSRSKSSSKSKDRHRSGKKSNKKHRYDDGSLSSERSRSKNRNRERRRKRSESSSVSESRSRSKSRRHRDRKRRDSGSRSGKRSSNKTEFPVFDEKTLFEKFEQITKQFLTQKGINLGNVEEHKEINDEKPVSQLDPMQEEHSRKPLDNHAPVSQEKETTNILTDPPVNEVQLHNSHKVEHVHVSSVPEVSEKMTPERIPEQKAQIPDHHSTIENISEAKSQPIPEPRQKSGFQYSSIDQSNKNSPQKKSSPEKPPIFPSSNIPDLKVSPVKEQERSKFVYSTFMLENRRQNLTLKLDKSPNPLVSFKEMTLSSYKNLAPQPNSSSMEVSSWREFNDNVFNTNLQNQQTIVSTEEAKDIVNEPKNYASQGDDEQKANKEAGLKFLKLLQRQKEIEEDERKLRLECLGTQEVSRPQQEPNLENAHQLERRQSYDLRETLNQMRQTEIQTHHLHRDSGMQQAAKSSQENVESSIDNMNDFIKKNNLEGFVKYLMAGGDLSTLKDKLGNLAKPN